MVAKTQVGLGRDEAWVWFEALPDAVKQKARARLLVIQKVEALEPALGRHMAVANVARIDAIGARTIWTWFAAIDGIRVDDRLAYIAPRNRASGQPPRAKECDPDFCDLIKSDFLRLEQPAFADCYRRAQRRALVEGWEVLPERTMRRRLDASVSKVTQVLMRQGVEAVKRMYPAQLRDKSALVAMEAVNADFHKFDVFVRWPAERGEEAKIIRPQMVAFQDIYSGRIVAWRLDQSPNSTAVLLAAGDMIEQWGIPEHILLDNGREFAAKSVTGGAATRYRFKVLEDDIPGLFTELGCTIHWATPYHGQAKPIERAFRDMCGSIAKDPRFAGAWTGNRPEAKPENYASKAIDLEVFLAVLAEGIEEHNTRQGRRSAVAFDRSFAEVFDESYGSAPVRKATEAQRRLWLMGAQGVRADRTTGEIKFMGNRFWDDWMQQVAGKRVIIRFDPANYIDGLHIYSQDNAYLGQAPCVEAVGFFDAEEAKLHSKAKSAWLTAERKAAEAHKRFSNAQIGAQLDGLAPPPAAQPEAKVVRPVFGKVKALATDPDADVGRAQAAMVSDLTPRLKPATETQEAPLDRFRRAVEFEACEALTKEQRKWLTAYQQSPEYRAQRMLWEDHGDAIFG
jgi:putative transposase